MALFVGCSLSEDYDSQSWSSAAEVAKSSDSLSTSFSLYKWNNSLLSIGGDSGTFATRIWDDQGVVWKTASTVDPNWIPLSVDAGQNKFLIARGILSSDRLEGRLFFGSLSSDGRFQSNTHAEVVIKKSALFPDAQSNLEMTLGAQSVQVAFAGAVMREKETRLPYCVRGIPIERTGRQIGYRGDLAVSANGVFATSDGGQTWHNEPISISYSEKPVMAQTKAFYYYFAKGGRSGPFQLWSSRCSKESNSWGSPETLNTTVAGSLSESLHAIGEEDVVHLCWLDSRNEKTRFSLTNPRAGNYEVAYRRRKDADATWGAEVMLSKSIRWSYAPSMSAEGKNLVVAWAGANGVADRTEYGPSDVYYVVSKDRGETWTKPVRITNNFKAGITSGRPQVALHGGMIHLFYIQGKLNYQKVSAGMVKLNQPPWPIYYVRRPFPK